MVIKEDQTRQQTAEGEPGERVEVKQPKSDVEVELRHDWCSLERFRLDFQCL